MRSTYTNALLRAIYAHPEIKSVVIDDGGDKHRCANFRAAADVIDSVDDSSIFVFSTEKPSRETKLGWMYIILSNDGDEQLSDYTANDFMDALVASVKVTGDE